MNSNRIILAQMMFIALHIKEGADGFHLINRPIPLITNKDRSRVMNELGQDFWLNITETYTLSTGQSNSNDQPDLYVLENVQDNFTTDLQAQRIRRSPSICPQNLTYGSCPNIIDYPQCNMYHIVSVCPWKIENGTTVKCLTKTPCYGIHATFQNLECKPIDGGCNTTDVPAACIAVKPRTKTAKINSVLKKSEILG